MSRKPLQHNLALQHAIEEMRGDVDNRQILTRSQQRLDQGLTNVASYQMEAKLIRDDIKKTRGNIVQMTKLLDTLEGQERDIEVLLKSELDSVNALQQAGVSIDK